MKGPFPSVAAWCGEQDDCGGPFGPEPVPTRAGEVAFVTRFEAVGYGAEDEGTNIYLTLTTPRGVYLQRVGSNTLDFRDRQSFDVIEVTPDPTGDLAISARTTASHASQYSGTTVESVLLLRGGKVPATAEFTVRHRSGDDTGHDTDTLKAWQLDGSKVVLTGPDKVERYSLDWP